MSQALRNAANSNKLNIGTADHLVETIAPGAIKPGEIINWAIRLNPEELDKAISDLEKALVEYKNTINQSYIDNIDEGWDGLGARTFVERWNGLRSHIDDDGIKKMLEDQVAVMKQLRDDMEAFQSECTNAINNHLSMVRVQYVKALCQEVDGAALYAALSGAGTGASLGAMVGGAPGAGVGAILMGVLGLIETFNTTSKARIAALLGLQTSSVNILTIGDSQFSLGEDSVSGKSLEYMAYEPGEHSSLSQDGWEFDESWEAK